MLSRTVLASPANYISISLRMGEPGNKPDINLLLAVIREMVGEVHPHWKHLHFTPDTHLEKELGLDSMARVELCTRIEAALDIKLDDTVIARATTAQALLDVILDHHAAASGEDSSDEAVAELLMGSFGQPDEATDSDDSHSLSEWLYALYSWTVFLVVGTVTWIIVVLAPFATWRRKLAHLGARLFFLLTFTPLRVTGNENIDPEQTYIVAANHTSYLDGFIVTAALDIPIHFIVKGELARFMPARVLLQRFGVEFVDRFNGHRGASDVRRITQKTEGGQTIVFFPEGTFTTFEGLQPFRMGAFVTAARAGVPLLPVAIRGARSIVRGSDWFPHRGAIDVTICTPVQPEGEGWQVALDLRNAARAEIVRHCGEPDLVEVEYESERSPQ